MLDHGPDQDLSAESQAILARYDMRPGYGDVMKQLCRGMSAVIGDLALQNDRRQPTRSGRLLRRLMPRAPLGAAPATTDPIRTRVLRNAVAGYPWFVPTNSSFGPGTTLGGRTESTAAGVLSSESGHR